MPRKEPFPPEADTEPDLRRTPRPSGSPAKGKRDKTQASTAPPPAKTRNQPKDTRSSGIQARRSKRGAGATVDEVVADLSKDPRRERE
jgi:hypothetical protein